MSVSQPELRTPCVGLCSTTYGDLVCRGCRRFAHEIVAWNGYPETQRRIVWARLDSISAMVAGRHIRVVDASLLARALVRHRIPCRGGDGDELRALRLLQRGRLAPSEYLGAGFEPRTGTAETLGRTVDRELHARAIAEYERAYRVRIEG